MSESVGDVLPASRKEAREMGEKRYLSETPCPKGHVGERQTTNGSCCQCNLEKARNYRIENRPVVNETARKYRERHPDRVKEAREKLKDWDREYQRYYHKTLRGRAQRLRNCAKRRSNDKNLKFTINSDWVFAKLLNGKCEVTGIPFEFLQDRGPWTPSIDRKIPSDGYTEDNCQVVVWIYNSAKANFKHEDVIDLAKSLVEVK